MSTDIWNWDDWCKVKSIEMYNVVNPHIRVQQAIDSFQCNHGMCPNTIIMGYHLSNELYTQFAPIIDIKEVVEIENKGRVAAYEGIPVEIDMNNPNRLCVGYMEECCWGKEYE